ncbi:Mitotic checkpoint protein PRCC [Ascosphaera apis ARSEF 7405]|uniref:Mitotic checkpoint protein PRCC n=1 Tax=Ascosphaera apis ARSEF 7405 TaxID=392613 RepID=A0A167V4J7_9EURO|nr:Mitotic checkpoint protein PRCC [Ascosphaera apis ARSEF 7405]
MALVTYGDSDSSDNEESPVIPAAKPSEPAKKSAPGQPQKLVDRSNPRKILVNLSNKGTEDGEEDTAEAAPLRRKPRAGGGMFAGFNDLLPAPKRPAQQKLGGPGSGAAVTARKPFSFKTAAEPSFSREETSVAEPSREGSASTETATEKKPEEEVKIQGNAMMFKPLSVARNTNKRRRVATSRTAATASAAPAAVNAQQAMEAPKSKPESLEPTPAPKPKVNLFGISKEPDNDASQTLAAPEEDLDYNYETITSSLGPAPSTTETEATEVTQYNIPQPPEQQQQPQQASSLATIADDLNLSKAQKRQLFGRQGASGNIPSLNDANVVHFNTDQEYASNAAYLANVSEQELAAQQHNPVRSIAPGKHSLQQLVNSVHNQRDALEESFASGKRNRKEAGSKYGW